jgi:hypothetical protein
MQQNDVLNNVLIVMTRSLLQYAAQAWPWSGNGATDLQTAVNGMIAAQNVRIQKLTDLMDDRRWTIDFGSYPDFSDLNYLALEFVMPHMVENEKAVVREIETALPQCSEDTEGSELLTESLQGERAALSKLEELCRPPAAAVAPHAA